MSLCCDFQKWIMISLASVTISLTVGLVLMQYAHGYISPEEFESYPNIHEKVLRNNALEHIVNYCFEHASSAKPIKDLVDKGFLSSEYQGQTCLTIKQTFDKVEKELADMNRHLENKNYRAK
jgi:hypothetical protein